jgi:hypothetical protein
MIAIGQYWSKISDIQIMVWITHKQTQGIIILGTKQLFRGSLLGSCLDFFSVQCSTSGNDSKLAIYKHVLCKHVLCSTVNNQRFKKPSSVSRLLRTILSDKCLVFIVYFLCGLGLIASFDLTPFTVTWSVHIPHDKYFLMGNIWPVAKCRSTQYDSTR